MTLAGVDQADNAFKAYSYLDDSGEIELQVPGIAGDYEPRYILHHDEQVIAERPITVD